LEINRAQSPEEKAKFERLLGDVEQQIKEYIELGFKEPKEVKEVAMKCRCQKKLKPSWKDWIVSL
jgi:hypothetical protein